MTYGPEYLKEQALKAAERRLRQAATFVSLNSRTPLFQKRMGKGISSVLVRVELPGVLKVIDPETGEVLAISLPGKPSVLNPDFHPSVPALDCGPVMQAERIKVGAK